MKLKELRKERKKTQLEISQILNIAPTTYGGYELGTSEPTIETLCKLADYYGVTLDYLIGRDSNEFAYLTDNEKMVITNFRKLSIYNQAKIIGEIAGVLLTQS